MPVGHAADTCHKGCEGPDDGNKTGNNDRFAAVFFKELVCPLQVLLIEKTDMLFMEYFRSRETPYPVVHRIAQNSSDDEKNTKPHHIKISSRREGACREKERITGQKGRYNKPGFTENYEKKDEIGPHAVGPDNLTQMYVNVYDELKKKFYKLQQHINKFQSYCSPVNILCFPSARSPQKIASIVHCWGGRVNELVCVNYLAASYGRLPGRTWKYGIPPPDTLKMRARAHEGTRTERARDKLIPQQTARDHQAALSFHNS